jgi:predicted permease
MALRRSQQLEADMREEMRFHVQMEAERLCRTEGLDPQEARRRALVSFGGVEKYKEEGREARGFRWLDSVSLDARLGLRMLVKHRWLTLVGGVAMAVAVAICASAFIVIGALLDPALPFPQGDRIVAVKYESTRTGNAERHVIHAFSAWRDHLTTIEQASAFRTVRQNLVVANAAPEPVDIAEITASAFTVAQVQPLLGRFLLASDEQPGAAPVLVIGYDAWRTRFATDPAVLGRSVQVAGIPHTVVGVMPARFGFPIDHQFWIPLRLDAVSYPAWQGPELHVLGRLAPGVTIEQAKTELAAIGRQFTDAYPDGKDRLRTVVIPYTLEHLELADTRLLWALRAARLLVGALSFVVAVNLAVLLYARTVTRLGEIAVRTAIGASRARILSQLFVEALALTGVGAAAGLCLCAVGLRYAQWLADANGVLPFWVRYELSLGSVVYVVALAIAGALIMGVLPGLKVTGARLSANLQELHGRTGTRLGSMWTTMIVAQVAVAVAILPAAVYLSWHVVKMQLHGPTIAVEQFVVANLASSDDDSVVVPARVRERQRAVISRLREIPGLSAVTFSSAVPGFGPDMRIEFEKPLVKAERGTIEVATFRVDVDMLKVYGARFLAGRDFDTHDTERGRAVIVNRTFAAEFSDSANVLGLRFRRSPRPELYEIVGVVDDFPGFPRDPGSEGEPTVYQPAALGELPFIVLSLRFGGAIPSDIAERLRRIGAEVDPDLQLERVVPLSHFNDELRSVWRGVAWAVAIVMISVLLLSAAGVHALMSFTIAQRTREIGIRSALGAQPRHLLLGVFGRALRQLSLGVLAGSMLSVVVFVAVGVSTAPAVVLLAAVAVLMMAVASLAALGPALRSLRLPTVDALRFE